MHWCYFNAGLILASVIEQSQRLAFNVTTLDVMCRPNISEVTQWCCPDSERLAKQLSKKKFRFIGINWKAPVGKFLLS